MVIYQRKFEMFRKSKHWKYLMIIKPQLITCWIDGHCRCNLLNMNKYGNFIVIHINDHWATGWEKYWRAMQIPTWVPGSPAAILAKDTCVTSELETYGLFRFFYLSRKHDQPQVLTNPHLCCDHLFKVCVLITHENLMEYPCSASF